MRQAKHTARIKELKHASRVILEDSGLDGRILLNGKCRLESVGSGRGPLAGFCEHGNEHPG